MWDFESNECLKTLTFTSRVNCVKKAANNKIICGFFDETIKIKDIESGECLVKINENFVRAILLISNERFVTRSFDEKIKLFDLNTYECIRTLIGHGTEIYYIDQISDHQIVSCSNNGEIRIWDLNTGECLKIIGDHEDFASKSFQKRR